jgi:hypothetical protein
VSSIIVVESPCVIAVVTDPEVAIRPVIVDGASPVELPAVSVSVPDVDGVSSAHDAKKTKLNARRIFGATNLMAHIKPDRPRAGQWVLHANVHAPRRGAATLHRKTLRRSRAAQEDAACFSSSLSPTAA